MSNLENNDLLSIILEAIIPIIQITKNETKYSPQTRPPKVSNIKPEENAKKRLYNQEEDKLLKTKKRRRKLGAKVELARTPKLYWSKITKRKIKKFFRNAFKDLEK